MKKIIAFFSLGLLISSCAVHRPPPVELTISPPPVFSGKTAPGLLPERWWESFGDARLDRFMEEAFTRNLDLARGFARLDAARAVLRSTASARRPSLNARGEWSREDTPSFFGNNTGDSYGLSLAAAFEVDLWRRQASRTDAAALDATAAAEDLKALYLTLSANLADLYYLAAEQRGQLRLQAQTIGSFTETVRWVEERYREGLVPVLDLYQARWNLAAAQARRSLFDKRLVETEHALSVLLGRYPEENMPGPAALPRNPADFPAGIPSDLLARRPDVKAALLRVQSSDARVAAAIAERFPSMDLAANFGKSSLAFSTGDIAGTFRKLIADAAAPILDGGRRRAEVDRNKAQFAESLVHYQQTVLTAFQEVEDALMRNRTTEDRIARLKQKVDAGDAALRLSRVRYLEGLTDYLPVLEARAANLDSRSELLSVRRQLVSDRITLARALGGGWMEEEMKNQRLKTKNEKQQTNKAIFHKETPYASSR